MRRLFTTLALVVALAGCGGDESVSTKDYRAELEKICAESNKRTQYVQKPTRATSEAIADYLQRLRDINVQTIAKVEKLETPDELKDAHERALEANRVGREKVDAVIT